MEHFVDCAKRFNPFEIRTFSKTIYKNKLKWIRELNTRPDTIKLLEAGHSDVNHSKIFFDLPHRVMKTKTKMNKWDLIKSFCTAKENTEQKTTHKIGENIRKVTDRDEPLKHINASCNSI